MYFVANRLDLADKAREDASYVVPAVHRIALGGERVRMSLRCWASVVGSKGTGWGTNVRLGGRTADVGLYRGTPARRS